MLRVIQRDESVSALCALG